MADTAITAIQIDWPGAPADITEPDRTIGAHDVQAITEIGDPVVDDGTRIGFMGRDFRISDTIGMMPLLKFAATARRGVDSKDMEGMVALYDLIRDCVDQTRPQRPVIDPETKQPIIVDGIPQTEDDGPSEWDRFEDHAINTKADDEDLMGFVGEVIEVLSARPKRRRGSSSDGRPRISGNSKGASFSPDTRSRRPPDLDGLTPVADLLHH